MKPESRYVMEKYVEADDIIIEAGANVGTSTVELAKKCRFVYAFEPNTVSYAELAKNTKCLQNVKIFNLALGEKSKKSYLNLIKGNITAGATSILKYDVYQYDGVQETDVVRLDSLDIEADTLFLDCEGYEVELLTGANLHKYKKILVEFHRMDDSYNTKTKVLELLKGFQIIEDRYIIARR